MLSAVNGTRRHYMYKLTELPSPNRQPSLKNSESISQKFRPSPVTIAIFQRLAKPTRTSVAEFSIPPDTDNLEINEPFSWEELQHALSRSNGKSAGPDDLGYPLLKKLPLEGKCCMLEMLNQLWVSDTYPTLWKESLVVPIPKANEKDRGTSKFRPIALTSCMAKVFERMVNRRLKMFLETNSLLDHRQHAFRQGFGTSTYFATLGDVLKEAYDQEHHVEIISLDISKAFNRTWTPAVLKKTYKLGLEGAYDVFHTKLLDRPVIPCIGGEHAVEKFQRGDRSPSRLRYRSHVVSGGNERGI